MIVKSLPLLFYATVLMGCGSSTTGTLQVPDVKGERIHVAGERMREAGIDYEITRRRSSSTPIGHVISTSPGPGTLIDEADQVSIVLSNGSSRVGNTFRRGDPPSPSPPAGSGPQSSYEGTRRAMRDVWADLDREHHAAICDLVHTHGVVSAAAIFTEDWSPPPEPVAVREFLRKEC